MEERGIVVKETPVGDRHVLAALDKDGLALGGEQSGHIIFRRLATTGDGLLTGLVLADLVVAERAGRWPSCSTGWSPGSPRCWSTCPVPNTELLAGAEAVWSAVAEESRTGWATAAGCCCGRAAPSPWSGSWSRPRATGWPRRSPSGSGTLVGFELQAAAPARAERPRPVAWRRRRRTSLVAHVRHHRDHSDGGTTG